MEDYTLKIGSCVSRYVRQLAHDSSAVDELNSMLRSGKPFVETDFLVVAMIDVSGYSALTAALTKRGKIASELITQSIASYMNKIIEILSLFEGDIVKFLGDAILITFSNSSSHSSRNPENQAEICLRALQCCSKILKHLSEFEIDFSAYDNIGELSLANSPASDTSASEFMSSTKPTRRMSISREIMKPSNNSNRAQLRIHVALAAGDVSRLVTGIPDERLDYSIFGDCMSSLGEILDNTKAGEMGMDACMYRFCQPYIVESKNLFEYLTKMPSGAVLVKSKDALDGALPAPSEKTKERLENIVANHMLEMAASNSLEDLMSSGPAVVDIWSKFINQSLLHKYKNQQATNEYMTSFNRADLKNSSKFSIDTNKTQTSDSQSQLGSDLSLVSSLQAPAISRKNTSISVSGVRRLSTLSKQSTATASHAEYRVLTTMFVKMHWKVSAESAQKCMSTFLGCLKKHYGVLQQFSVDDKGQTLLAFFGLPPLTQPNNVKEAVLAAQEFLKAMRKQDMSELTIAVATGDLLVSELGNNIRSEASFLGDTVNICARMLSVTTGAILVDERSHQLVSSMFPWTDLGLKKFKGMSDGIRVLQLNDTDDSIKVKAEPIVMVGYHAEKAIIEESIIGWLESDKQALAVVEGESGSGKSTLLTYAVDFLSKEGVKACIAQGSEPEQATPYFAMQSIMSYIFRALVGTSGGGQGGNGASTFFGSKTTLNTVRRSELGSEESVSTSTVGTSIIQRHAMNRRSSIASRGGGSIMLNGELPATNSLYSKENGMRFLKVVGEHPDLSPLLKKVLPGIPLHETERTKSLDSKNRNSLLKSIVIKAILAFYNRSNEKSKAVFIFDDVQWMDNVSLEIISEIIRVCSKTCILMFMRPIKQYNLVMVQQMLGLPITRHIPLGGLPISDVESFMIEKLRSKGVDTIDHSIVSCLYEKTGGKPLMVSLITDSLFHRMDDICEIRSKRLVFKDPVRGPESSIFTANMTSVIQSQLDSLNPIYQKLLKMSSYFDQYFSLLDVAAVSNEPHHDADSLLQTIQMHDRFSYLVPQHPDSDSDTHDPQSDTSDTPPTAKYEYYFRHISIQTCLYEAQPYSERISMHTKIATYYESLLTPDTWLELIPSISFHYTKSNDLGKQIYYLEQLGYIYQDQYLVPETLEIFLRLMMIVEKNRERLREVVEDPEDILVGVRGAGWHMVLAMNYLVKLDSTNGTKHVLECLNRVGFPMPVKKWKVVKKLVGLVWAVRKLWKETKGGRMNTRELVEKVTERQRTEDEMRMKVLGCIREMFFWDKSITPAQYMVAVFECARIAMTYSAEKPIELLVQLMRLSFVFYFKVPKLAVVFRRRFEELLEEHKDSGNLQMDSCSHYIGVMDIARGKMSSSVYYYERSYENRKACNDFAGIVMAVANIGLAHFFGLDKQRMDSAAEKVKPLLEEAIRVGVWYTWIPGVLYHGTWNLLSGNLETSASWLSHYESKKDQLPPNAKPYEYTFQVAQLVQKSLDGDVDSIADFFCKFAESVKGTSSFMPGHCFTSVAGVLIATLPVLAQATAPSSHLNNNKLLRTRMVEGYKGMHWFNGFMHRKLYSQPDYWPMLVCQSMLGLLGDAGSKGNPRRVEAHFARLKREFFCPKQADGLGEMRFVKAMVAGILGKVCTKVEERERFVRVSVGLLEEAGFLTLIDWVNSFTI
ncbi:hypothetical protein HDV05_001979 [Chytridiales sp. JEL 0842]|nr:hypothetical protein HDV05_001979 [Chytridiales sp. JEL 0842]